jgi:hypothetical protein
MVFEAILISVLFVIFISFASALLFAALAWRFGHVLVFVISSLALVSSHFCAPVWLFVHIHFSCLINVRPGLPQTVPDRL